MSALIGHSRIAADDVESHVRSVADSVYGVLSPEDAGSTPARYSRHASGGPSGGKPEVPSLHTRPWPRKGGLRAPEGAKRASEGPSEGEKAHLGSGTVQKGQLGPFGGSRGPWGPKKGPGGVRGPKRPQENDHQHKKTTIKTPGFNPPF